MSLSWRNYPSDGTGRASTIGTGDYQKLVMAISQAEDALNIAIKAASVEGYRVQVTVLSMSGTLIMPLMQGD